MKELLAQYGLVGVFFGTILEGDGTLIVAGVLAHMGVFPLAAVLQVGVVGALVSDHVCYWLGRSRGPAIQATRAYLRFAPLVEGIARNVGAWEIVVARFVLGTRNVSMFFWGMRQLPYGRFTLLDFIGCALWASVFATVGFVGGQSATALIGRARQFELWLLVALVAAVAAVVVARAYIWRVPARDAARERDG